MRDNSKNNLHLKVESPQAAVGKPSCEFRTLDLEAINLEGLKAKSTC
jgi:hypothetical protein